MNLLNPKSDFWTETDEVMKGEFIKAGYWPNEVLWSVWRQAWKGGQNYKRELTRGKHEIQASKV